MLVINIFYVLIKVVMCLSFNMPEKKFDLRVFRAMEVRDSK